MIPVIMLDISKTVAFLHAIQNVVTENMDNRMIGANYTLNAKPGINNRHQARMGRIPEIMLDIMKIAAFLLRQTQHIVTENEDDRIIGENYTLKVKQGINKWHQALHDT